MNKEDFVSLECAKLLKVKGFDEPCLSFYSRKGWVWSGEREENFNETSNGCSRPTLYEAHKWLREEHGIYVEIVYQCNQLYGYELLSIPKHDSIFHKDTYRSMIISKTYESALNAGIIEALKLI